MWLSSRAADAGPEDVVGPALVEQDEGDEDQRDDAHHRERVVLRRGVAHREAVSEGGARDHDAREEAREERHDHGDRAEAGHRERPDLAPPVDEDDCEHGDPSEAERFDLATQASTELWPQPRRDCGGSPMTPM